MWNRCCTYLRHWMVSHRATKRGSIRAARRQEMDSNRFDRLAVLLSDTGTSRRSVLGRLAPSGFAAALASLGISGFATENAEAGKKGRGKKGGGHHKKKSSQSKAACLANCQPAGTSSGITSNQIFSGGVPPALGSCTLGTSTGCLVGSTCVLDVAGTQICVSSDQIQICTTSAECPTGFCASVGICLPCSTLGTSICGQGASQTCCAVGAQCHPTLNICLA